MRACVFAEVDEEAVHVSVADPWTASMEDVDAVAAFGMQEASPTK